MISLSLSTLSAVLGSDFFGKDALFTGVEIDSRKIQPKNLFVALCGKNFDGHDFIADAVSRGAAAVLVSREININIPQIIMPDTEKALGKLSQYWRDNFAIPFVAVTGSNGKTTVKNMIASIFKIAYGEENYLATQGNFNNAIGLPLNLCRLNRRHRAAVLEMGMSSFGEICYLSNLVKPLIAVITNVFPSHVEGVGSIEGVAKAKAEIFDGLSSSGTVILNREDKFFDYFKKIALAKQLNVVTIGYPMLAGSPVISAEAETKPVFAKIDSRLRGNDGAENSEFNASSGIADITAENISCNYILNYTKFDLITPVGQINIILNLLGEHNIKNALAAAAAALALNISLETIAKGLALVESEYDRLEIKTLPSGTRLINDSYNANPASVKVAIDILASFEGEKILVLGDMKELGENEKCYHAEIGEYAKAQGVSILLTLGELTQETTNAFNLSFNPTASCLAYAQHFKTHEALSKALHPLLKPNTTVLVKGSHSMEMGRVITVQLC